MRTAAALRVSFAVAALAAALGSGPVAARAQAKAPAAAPSAPAGPADPCTSLSTLVSRPTFSTATCAVKPHDLLIESGYTNATTSGTGANETVVYPQPSLRVGVAHNLEFDLDPTSLERMSGTPRITGVSDSAIGAKYEFGYTSKVVYGINVVYTLANGSDAFSANGDGILVNVNAGLTLSPALSLFGTVGYNAQSLGTPSVPARYHDVQPSLGASLSLPQNFSLFAEGFGQSSTAPGLGGRYGIDTGFERGVGSRLQLDFNYFDYLGVQSGGHLHALGFGAAYLIGP